MRVRIHHLSKGFRSIRGNVFALRDISMEIENGEFFVLLGPSGSGKSTLLNLISGLETPTHGEIWFDRMLVASHAKGVSLSPKERNVAFVFQSYALYPHMNVFENIAFPLKIRGTERGGIRESVERTASLLEISDLLSAKPGELSGGQRQRVAIARAIVRHPNIFLLDEPLSNLDPQLRLSMRTELKKIQRSLGVTTIYVTHDQTEAMSLGDRIAVLRNGEIEQTGHAG
jgi:multiple sugar transport system ATP-binding protein